MGNETHSVLCSMFVLFFIFYITESHNWKNHEINGISRNNFSDEKNLSLSLNFSERASCKCKNGECIEGKGCVCYPGYGNISDTECHACGCGKGINCTIAISKTLFGIETYSYTCICKEIRTGICGKCNCGKNFECTVGKGPMQDRVKCTCKEGYVVHGSLCVAKNGCEDNGGDKECQKKGEFFTCINDEQNISKYSCECKPGYKNNDEKCVAQTGCEDNGGDKECQKKGEFFTCINDEQNISKYSCECKPGYKNNDQKCVAKTGCEDNGGNKECQEKGEFLTCINDEQNISKYLCECKPGYKINDDKCVAKTGCEDYGGSEKCRGTGNFFTCINDKLNVSKYVCDCLPGYKLINRKCIVEDCNCGSNSYACSWDKSTKVCNCFHGYAQLGDLCSDCHCGENTASCFFDRNNRNICLCREGFAQRNGTCSEMCSSDAECLNGGYCSFDGYGSFCKCIIPFTGGRCEINEICESMKPACSSIGAVCRYVHSIKQGFCMCPPNKTYNEDLKMCEEKLEFTSIFFIVLCSATVLLLLSIVILIILLKKFRWKLENLCIKSP